MKMIRCETCGHPFEVIRATEKCCSDECISINRKRKAIDFHLKSADRLAKQLLKNSYDIPT